MESPLDRELGFVGAPVVRESCYLHADISSENRGQSSGQESNCSPGVSEGLLNEAKDDCGHYQGEDQDVLVFLVKEGLGSLFDVRSDLQQQFKAVLVLTVLLVVLELVILVSS